MNLSRRTYGIVINMDYEHHRYAICKALWDEIANHMKDEHFSFDKRMFVLTTELGKEAVCDKARKVLEELEGYKESYEKRVFNYVKDFYAIDMTEYVDLSLPQCCTGIEVEEEVGEEIKLN